MGWNKLRIIVNLGVLALIIALALPACIKLWRNRKDPAALKAMLLRHKKLLIFLGLLVLYFFCGCSSARIIWCPPSRRSAPL